MLNSNVFQYNFDFDEWPGTHTVYAKYLRPYNGSIFSIRNDYYKVFPEQELREIDENDKDVDNSKIYKIKYMINLLPSIAEYRDVGRDEDKLVNANISLPSML